MSSRLDAPGHLQNLQATRYIFALKCLNVAILHACILENGKRGPKLSNPKIILCGCCLKPQQCSHQVSRQTWAGACGVRNLPLSFITFQQNKMLESRSLLQAQREPAMKKETRPTQTLSSFFTGVAQKFRLRGAGGVTRVHSLSLHPDAGPAQLPPRSTMRVRPSHKNALPMGVGCETNRKHADHNKKPCVNPVYGTEECVLC